MSGIATHVIDESKRHPNDDQLKGQITAEEPPVKEPPTWEPEKHDPPNDEPPIKEPPPNESPAKDENLAIING
jgi:hypothetical protein